MADEEKKENEEGADEAAEGEEQPKKSKKPMFLGGGIVGLIAAAYIVSMVALPSERVIPPFADTPFITDLSAGDVQVNLKGNNGSRYLVMSLQAKYHGYDETYVTTRVADPVYQAEIKDLLISHGRQKTMADVEDTVGEEAFFEEIREAVNPLMFPVHVGNATSYQAGHEESGIGPGVSAQKGTMRGGFQGHFVHVDAPKGKIRLDEGPERDIDTTDDDFLLETEHGESVFVDLTKLDPEFVGEVQVGTFGYVARVLKVRFLFQ